MSGFSHLFLGLSALKTFRQAMNTAGNNVANAATPGFARRRVELHGLPDQLKGAGAFGLGVEISTVRRLSDPFLEFATRREMSRLGGDGQRTALLGQIEPLLGPVEGAPLGTSLAGVFDAFAELAAVGADDLPARQGVIEAAETFAATVRRVDDGLAEQRRAANGRVESAVTRVNEIVEGLAEINRQIVPLEAGGAEAGQLRDDRSRLLDELSSLVSVRTIAHENGQVSVHLDVSGDTLLDHSSTHALELATGPDGMHRVTVSRGGRREDITDLLRSGELGGTLAVRDETLATYRARLDDFAAAAIDEFNRIHRSGFDLNGDPGTVLFTPDPPGGSAGSSIAVNAALAADPRLVAAAGSRGGAGDNANALRFDDLRGRALVALGGVSLGRFVSDLVSGIGRETATAEIQRQASEAIVLSLEEKRHAVSGVSLDEEAAQLAMWQQSFQASARFMETVNRVTEIAMQLLAR